jgi:hypothetical protein
MSIIRNLLALIGLLTLAAAIYIIVNYSAMFNQYKELDPEAGRVYLEMAKKLMETGNSAEATIWKVPVKQGISPEDVDTSMKSIASEHNIKNVGELPLYKQVEAMSGKPYRFVKIYMFCDALTASRMIDYSDAFSAYLPCRVTLLEDKTGKLWLYTLNMDLMIYGGKPLPPALKKEAIQVKKIINDIMNRGSKGDF